MELAAMSSLLEEHNVCMFIRISDNGRHRALKTFIDNKHLLKKDELPSTLQIVLNLLVEFYTPGNGPLRTVPDIEKSGVDFFQQGKAPKAK